MPGHFTLQLQACRWLPLPLEPGIQARAPNAASVADAGSAGLQDPLIIRIRGRPCHGRTASACANLSCAQAARVATSPVSTCPTTCAPRVALYPFRCSEQVCPGELVQGQAPEAAVEPAGPGGSSPWTQGSCGHLLAAPTTGAGQKPQRLAGSVASTWHLV